MQRIDMLASVASTASDSHFLQMLRVVVPISALLKIYVIWHPDVMLVVLIQRHRHEGAWKRRQLHILVIRIPARSKNGCCWWYMSYGLGAITPSKEDDQ